MLDNTVRIIELDKLVGNVAQAFDETTGSLKRKYVSEIED